MSKQKVLGWKVGARYFIQTVTHYYVGDLLAVTPQEFVLGNVAWVPDTGRHHEFVAGKEPNEMEAWPADAQVIVGRGALVAASLTTQKAVTK